MKAKIIEESRKKSDAWRSYLFWVYLYYFDNSVANLFLTFKGMNRNYNRIKIGINISLRSLFLILKEIIIIEK